MKKRAITAIAVSALILMGSTAAAEDGMNISITVEPENTLQQISPYIYGVNSGVDLDTVSAGSFRLGGNRMSCYNWENNMSNAGSDWYNSADMHMVQDVVDDELRQTPGGAALNAAMVTSAHNVPYKLLTLQMLGYVSSSTFKKLDLIEGDCTAPNTEYWYEVVNRKPGEFLMEPDKKDNVVYTDEYLNYLINTLGDSANGGFNAYALDNEPGLWNGTHSLAHSEHVTCDELIEKSTDLAKVVKDMDGGAEVFGPSLYGYTAYQSLAGAPDWSEKQSAGGYRWFIDYYLDEMKKAEKQDGRRLLDVLDIHYYTEENGECGQRSCNHYDNDGCVRARLDSVRSLFEDGYREKSWITDTGAEFFPLIPNIQKSIDEYYPGTKLAFTEYNFGGGDHISGGVCQADVMGIFAENGVYFSTLWSFDENQYQLAAINMFTNYDGKGSGFGDTLVKSESSDRNTVSVYSSTDENGTLRMILTNKSLHEGTPVSISISGENDYSAPEMYELYGDSAEIRNSGTLELDGNTLTCSLKPLSVTELVFEPLKPVETAESDKGTTSVPIVPAAVGGAVAVAALVAFALVRKNIRKQ